MAQSSLKEQAALSPLESEAFKVYCYKIVPCAKKFGHDWSECPFAHEGEKATRRCPALYLYSSIVCPEVRQSKPCPRGDACLYSHSIFEYWMHPARFRAQICSFGAECNRRICFFAHAQEQLRVPSEPVVADALAARAPYLQGRVCPKSRYALYPEQVPAVYPIAGMAMGQQTLLTGQSQDLAAAAAAAGQGMPQIMFVPAAGDAARAGLGMGPAAAAAAPTALGGTGQVAALQQPQWAAPAGGGLVYMATGAGGAGGVPSTPSAGGGLRYYVQPAAPDAVGSTVWQQQQQFSTAMQVMPGTAVQLAAAPAVAGGSDAAAAMAYGGQQLQLVTAMAPDGSIAQYPMAQAGTGPSSGGGIAYASPMYAMAGTVPSHMQQVPAPPPLQQHWAMQQQGSQQQAAPSQQRQHQQLQQLMQVAKGGEALGRQPGTRPDAFLLAQQQQPYSAALQPQRSMGVLEAPAAYAVLASPGRQPGAAGAALVQPGNPPGGTADIAAAGGGNVDEITQQMGGWRIS